MHYIQLQLPAVIGCHFSIGFGGLYTVVLVENKSVSNRRRMAA